MPKGTVHLLVILAAALGFWGVWKWWMSTDTPEASGRQIVGSVVRPGGETRDSGAETRSAAPGRPLPPDQRFEEGEILVVNPPDRFEAIVGQLGFTVLERIRLNQLAMTLYRLRVPRGSSVADARQALASRFPGVTIDVNQQYEMQAVDDYRHRVARALAGWRVAKASCGAGVKLGMIDAPVDTAHQALAGRRIEYRSFHNPERRLPLADHGTAVAAILIGKPEWGGLLPGAQLKAANMFELNEVGSQVGNAVGLLKAMDWLIQEQVQVINMSVAGGDNKVVRTAIEQAGKRDMVVVAAAGNWGSADRPAYPAAYEDVIAVTALGEKQTIYSQANRGPYIDFSAPGVDIYTAVARGGRLQSGTSFAAPFISAVAATEIAKGAPKNPAALLNALRPNVIDLGPPGKDDTFGWGLVQKQPECG